MSGVFYGTLRNVEALADKLVIRCVREYFHGEGLMKDDVWIWEIEHPEQANIAALRSLIGRSVNSFEVTNSDESQFLLISLDEGHETISIIGKLVRKTEESRNGHELIDVVIQLSQQFRRAEADYSALSHKLSDVVVFVEQTIGRIQLRAEFEKERGSHKVEAFKREIEDLQIMLRKLKERSS